MAGRFRFSPTQGTRQVGASQLSLGKRGLPMIETKRQTLYCPLPRKPLQFLHHTNHTRRPNMLTPQAASERRAAFIADKRRTVAVMPCGRHVMEPAHTVPADYLRWAIRFATHPPLLRACRLEAQRRGWLVPPNPASDAHLAANRTRWHHRQIGL